MYNGIVYLHSLLRWVLLLLLFLAIFRHLAGMMGRKPFTRGDRKLDLFLMVSAHIQLLIGLYQWFLGPLGFKNIQNLGFGAVMKNSAYRFWAVEHTVGMIIAIMLITIGRGVVKKNISDTRKHTRAFWLFAIALIIILITVPWPFRQGIGRPWFPAIP